MNATATSASVLDSFQLRGRRALITGSSAGIGFALARALGEAGAQVVLNGRDTLKLEQAGAALRAEGLSVHTRSFDVTQCASKISRGKRLKSTI